MAREKKPVHKVVMTEGKRNIIQQLLQEYDIQSAEDIQEALKDLLGGTIKEMMEAEIVYSCAGVPLFRRNGNRQSGGRKPLNRNRDTALNCLLPASLLA